MSPLNKPPEILLAVPGRLVSPAVTRGVSRVTSAVALLLLAGGCTGGSDPAGGGGDPAAPAAGEQVPASGVLFTDITEAAGIRFRHRAGDAVKDYIVEAKGGGGALFDADGDGWLDLYFANGARLSAGPSTEADALYLNRGDGTFAEVNAGGGDRRWGMGAAAADVDNDGDADLLVTRYDGATLYSNTSAPAGSTRFVDAGGLSLDGWCTGAAFADYDLDGDLDLYVARYLDFDTEQVPPRAGMWKGLMVFAGPQGLSGAHDVLLRNDGDAFSDVSEEVGLRAAAPSYGLGVVFGDIDDDGDPDVFVANDSAPNYLFRNDRSPGGDRSLREVGVEARVAFSAEGTAQAGMGVAYDDFDDDGDRDLFVTHFEDDYNTLYRNDGYRNDGAGRFAVASHELGLGQVGVPWLAFGTCFLDADNDGDLDLAVGNGHVYPQIRHLGAPGYAQPDHLFLNRGPEARPRFELVAAGDLSLPAVTRGLMKGDWDGDGDIDLVAMRLDNRPALLRNDTRPAGNHWLIVDLEGTTANRDGLGALVRVVAAGLNRTVEVVSGGSYLSHSDTRAHFGLGDRTTVERIEIRWPGGALQTLGPMPVDRVVRVRQQ